MITGGCYCGKIRFTFKGEDLPPVVYCHCSQCRRISGHYVAAVSGVENRTHIEGNVKWFDSSPGYERGFCPDCGTHVFWHDKARGHLSIMAGAFDAGTPLVEQDHIYIAEKPDYYTVDDGLPQFVKGRS